MKQKITALFLAMVPFIAEAQISSQFFGVARKNTPSNEVFLARVNPATGLVTSIGATSLSESINLTGAALDPYNNNFHYVSGNEIKTINLSTGALTNSAAINNPIASSYFENFRFNNSDTTLYGLARRVTYDPVTMESTGEVYLATINTATGQVTQISPTSVAQGYSLGGSAIDPFQKIFYFTGGLNLMGIDMYTGTVYSNVAMSIDNGIAFDNLAYSCADTTIYGLIRQNYYDTIVDPLDPTMVTEVLDSTTIHLGKIDPATGVVTAISPYSIAQGGYSLNSGATIDPNTMTYYYNKGNVLVGVSLATGTIVSENELSYTNGQFFDLMRIHDDCITATSALRPDPRTLSVTAVDNNNNVTIAPNPSEGLVNISSSAMIDKIEILDMTGKCIYRMSPGSKTASADLSGLTNGVYIARIYSGNNIATQRVVKQ